ncbi:MAG: HesA/MoeB/ThiF family protein [Bdellovibrio sp.]|nr:HesA/MoeB/ThiF family protein [Bdellovibrio sp.]
MIDRKEYFKRQIIMRDFGMLSQEKLLASRVVVVGAGGLGHPALVALALAGVGHLTIVDHDRVDVSNLHRQFLFSPKDSGSFKADVAKSRLEVMAPFLTVESMPVMVVPENIIDLIKKADMVLDCSDNFKAKFLIHDACLHLKKKLVQTSIYQYEGQILYFDAQKDSPCLRCLYPEKLSDGCVGNCAEVGVLGATAMAFGSLQAMVAVEALLDRPNIKTGEILTFDLKSMESMKHSFAKKETCAHCTHQKSWEEILLEYQTNYEIDLPNALKAKEQFVWIDIRSSSEIQRDDYLFLNDTPALPLFKVPGLCEALEKHKKYLFFCARGIRSQRLVDELHRKGVANAYSLKGGLSAVRGL